MLHSLSGEKNFLWHRIHTFITMIQETERKEVYKPYATLIHFIYVQLTKEIYVYYRLTQEWKSWPRVINQILCAFIAKKEQIIIITLWDYKWHTQAIHTFGGKKHQTLKNEIYCYRRYDRRETWRKRNNAVAKSKYKKKKNTSNKF